MPTTLQTAISKKTAQGVVEGVELAAPIAREQVKREADTLLHSRAARRSGLVTGCLVFVVLYGVLARRRRLERIEEKLDAVVDEVAGDADS